MTKHTTESRSTIKISVLEDANFEEEYSANDNSGSDSGITPNIYKDDLVIIDDTDIEIDDGLKEYSEATIEKSECKTENEKIPKLTPQKKDIKSASLSSKPPACLQTSRCSTQCAGTYRNRRNRRKLSTQQNLCSDESDDNSTSSPGPAVRRKLRDKSEERILIEGTFKQCESLNYEEYLTATGAGPCTRDMVMRAGQVLRITQDLDKQWRVSTETIIRGKSTKGYRTNTRKWTENKFKVGEEKPEILDDWDQRLVVTLLDVNPEKTKLTLHQTAEKDQCFANDSIVEFEVDPTEPDILLMRCQVGEVVAFRKFERQINNPKFSERKTSAPF